MGNSASSHFARNTRLCARSTSWVVSFQVKAKGALPAQPSELIIASEAVLVIISTWWASSPIRVGPTNQVISANAWKTDISCRKACHTRSQTCLTEITVEIVPDRTLYAAALVSTLYAANRARLAGLIRKVEIDMEVSGSAMETGDISFTNLAPMHKEGARLALRTHSSCRIHHKAFVALHTRVIAACLAVGILLIARYTWIWGLKKVIALETDVTAIRWGCYISIAHFASCWAHQTLIRRAFD